MNDSINTRQEVLADSFNGWIEQSTHRYSVKPEYSERVWHKGLKYLLIYFDADCRVEDIPSWIVEYGIISEQYGYYDWEDTQSFLTEIEAIGYIKEYTEKY